MDKAQLVRFLGLFVFVVMALSMVAIGVLSVDKNSTNTNDDQLPSPTENAFTYSLSFDTNALKELSSMRIGAMTSQTNKAEIDAAVLKVEGVSKVSSQFKKTSVDANEWVYLAEISLKKGSDASSVAKEISDINFFGKEQGFEAMKYITISSPSSVMLHNADLNIDRNFSFPMSTTSALSNLATQSGDELVVEGTIKVQGKAILALELIEKENKTQEKLLEDYMKQIQADQNKPLDSNVPSADNNA